MSKAEEFAIKKYPVSIEDIHGHKIDVNLWQRKACVDGYHQAEKDLELTWEDISKIISIDQQVCGTIGISDYTHNHQQAMEEVLKRFKNFKERKEK